MTCSDQVVTTAAHESIASSGQSWLEEGEMGSTILWWSWLYLPCLGVPGHPSKSSSIPIHITKTGSMVGGNQQGWNAVASLITH